jgi:hypothetical protein
MPQDYLSDRPQDERGCLIVRHEVATGLDCNGHLIIEERGGVADVKCNSCGTVVDTVLIIDRVLAECKRVLRRDRRNRIPRGRRVTLKIRRLEE